MILKSSSGLKIAIILMLIISILFTNTVDSQAKRKKRHRTHRSYNKEATKKMTMKIVASNQELADLAGVPYDTLTCDVSVDENDEIIGELGEDINELEAEDTFAYDAENFQSIFLALADDGFTAAGISKNEIYNEAESLFGIPYRFGGVTERALDCSAFSRLIFEKVAKIRLPRTAREQIQYGAKIKDIDELEFGDLVFFHTYSRRFASHVGIYLTDGLFVHAGTRNGVTITSINSPYYTKRFIGGRRLTEKDLRKLKFEDNNEDDNTLKAAM